ncbi:MAG TPA: hypothetical protein VMW16_02045 [Sedimentisphaerales bacterium]|nr:hypothetical protein [Sedimentisphaerales bacterium]
MEGFNRESRQSIYFEVSYVIASEWSCDTMQRLDFQKSLAERQLDFPQTNVGPNNFILVRLEPSALQVKAALLGPRVSSISISSKRPVHSLNLFNKEAEAVCDAYHQTWLKQQCQILQCNARIQHLYSCHEHAFKYLWEQRLGQQPQDFSYLGKRPVLGGGLRLVMPPLKEDVEPVQIELKIESFFPELGKMFIETSFLWPQPRLLKKDEKFDPELRLKRVEKYALNEVCDFVMRPATDA